MHKGKFICLIIPIALAVCLTLALSACGGEADGATVAPPVETGGFQNGTEEGTKDNFQITITAGGREFTATLFDNAASNAFAALLPMTVDMSDMPHEKYYYLQDNLPTDTYNPGTIMEGDLMLWGSNCLVLFYETFATSYGYTRLGKIKNTAGLAAALGRGGITVSFAAA